MKVTTALQAADQLDLTVAKLAIISEMFSCEADITTCSDGLKYLTDDAIRDIYDVAEYVGSLRKAEQPA